MKILFVTDPYPTNIHPNNGVFVYNFVQQLVALGHQVTVITPYKANLSNLFKPKQHYGEEAAKVFRPKVVTASAKKIGPFHTYTISRIQKVRAVRRIVKKHQIEFDVVYCHFIQSALFAIEALKDYNKPFFVAVGENNSLKITKKWYSLKDYNYFLSYVKGYIAVSDVVKEKLIALNGINPNLITVARNGADLSRFNKISKQEARKQLGLNLEQFLVVFVGRFVESKGPLRLINATKDIKDLGLVMVGAGPQQLNGEHIVFQKSVPKDLIPVLLKAGDVFVLPTLHEGSNNAIVEAMASGLPIISSDIPEVKEQVNEELAILIDPLDESQIRNAILNVMQDDSLRERMSEASLIHSENFDIQKRAEKIIEFINKKLN